MQLTTLDTIDFLQLNALLQQTLAFAKDNPYQQRPLSPARLAAFGAQMQQLFIFSERWQLLPEQISLAQAEQVSAVYPDTQSALLDLLYSCPLPSDAEHWFDYQQEYRARTQQSNGLSTLIHWHQQLYQQLLSRFPLLQLPFPPGASTAASDATTVPAPETLQPAACTTPPCSMLPALLL
ncbi:hypothetical protein EOE67_16285 [Rheinheimera riviphila]|uniref:Uncharacterized protein n=1 Tax=Rheinheimera riviphila TaxID=1834037 RepID=A0A437QGP3_9GAMM|nr:hypothetical protein [Rheinheimera riviphila]RVU33574.1 hypothetical protein EOE67_16285 [Rheinheimera riviphila]